jgi:hypothetical protein
MWKWTETVEHDCGVHGHRFEQRYDQRLPFVTSEAHHAFEVLSEKTYVCDICVRCGKVITRNPSAPLENTR